MTVLIAVAGVVFFVVLLLLAFNIGLKKANEGKGEEQEPVIHHSGIYSIVRKSPRENVHEHKPGEEEIRKYLEGLNENSSIQTLSQGDKDALITEWKKSLEYNIAEIEAGDREGVEFYRYTLCDKDAICDEVHLENKFVSREQIFRYPMLIPPFHLGCRCCLERYAGDEESEDEPAQTNIFIAGDTLPELPEWQRVNAISTSS